MPRSKAAPPHSSSQANSLKPTAAARVSPSEKAAISRIQGLESEIAGVIQAMQEKVRQLELMNGLSSLLNSTLDPAVVREKALQATCELLRCETASLFLVDRAKGELYFETALGEAGKELQRSVRLPINDRSLAGYVAMTGECLIVNDLQKDPRHFKSEQSQSNRTMICVPLKAKDRTIGVLQALNKISRVGSAPKNAAYDKYPWAAFDGDDRKLLESLSHQVAIAIENAQLYTQIKRNFYDTCEALAEAIEKKDRYTGGHTKRVVHYSLCIAKYLPMTADELELLRLGAVLHDVGKIGIEDSILKKQSPLDEAEWKVMKTHPEQGYDILSRVEGLRDVMGGMRYHHERWDGKGYPLGLKGEEIPLIARIISVADTYDAMVSTRPYRKGMDPKFAFDEIVRYRGTQFDPAVVDAFVLAFQNEKMGKGSGGSRLGSADPADPALLSNCD